MPLTLAPDQTAARAFWDWGARDNWTGKRQGQPSLPITAVDWSVPCYPAAEADTTINLYPSCAGGQYAPIWEPGRWDSIWRQGTPAPSAWPLKLRWGSTWRTGAGSDSIVLIETTSGDTYEIQNLRRSNLGDWIPMLFAGFGWPTSSWVCDQVHLRSAACRARETHLVRGAGRFAKGFGLLRVADVEAGVVRGPLALVGFNVQHGPPTYATPGYRPPRAVNGARVEHPDLRRMYSGVPPGDHERAIPHGTILAHTRDEHSIEQWAFERHRNPAKAATARTIARALSVDQGHGMQILETGDGVPQIECEGLLNPRVAQRWARVGIRIPADLLTLLDGLYTAENTVVVNP